MIHKQKIGYMSDPLLKVQGLSKSYAQYQAVKPLDLKLQKGEVLGLLGPNGAGKSTTMQMLTGSLAPTLGEVKIQGIDLLDHPRKAKQHLGYLPEQPPLYSDLTVNEFLSYCAKLRSLSTKQAQAAIKQACQRCDLWDVRDRLIGNLSKGFRQRIGIAQAILHNPSIIILDEPTVGLDPIQITQIRSLIKELGKEHGVILSTHILPEVQVVCDRVQIMVKGESVYSAPLLSNTLPVLELRLSHSIDSNQLSCIAEVTHVSALDSTYDLHLAEHTEINVVTNQVMQIALQQQWSVISMTPKQASLEQVFMRWVHHDQPEQEVVA